VKADPVASLDVGDAGVLVQQQDQFGALAKLKANGTAAGGQSGVFKEVGGEDGAKRRGRTGHGRDPAEAKYGFTFRCPSAYCRSLARQPLSYF
jgi:hypothetical protein